MSYGPIQAFTCGIASGASSSSILDLGGKTYSKLAVNAVTMSTAAQLAVWGCPSSTGTFLPIKTRETSTATSGYNALAVVTNTSGAWAMFDAPPFRYIQFIASAVVSGGVSITVLAND